MKGYVSGHRQLRPIWYDERFIVGANRPIENTDQDFEGCSAHREVILDTKQAGGGGYVRENGSGERRCGECEADDGKVLKVPSV